MTSASPSFPTGYDAIAALRASGWWPVPSWGRDGYDLGSWPLVIVLWRDTLTREGGRYELAYYVEGDVELRTFASAAERERATDEIAAYHWRHEGAPWVAGYPEGPLPPELRGPPRA